MSWSATNGRSACEGGERRKRSSAHDSERSKCEKKLSANVLRCVMLASCAHARWCMRPS